MSKHIIGGISIYQNESNIFECLNCTIANNKGRGIDIMGEGNKVIIQDNKICFNQSDGVSIGMSVEAFCL